MTRIIKVAFVQMNFTPAPVQKRLVRSEPLALDSSQAGAQLIAFPEVFNTGYVYSSDNYALTEPFDAPTFTWMRQTAARLEVHLSGSNLLCDQTEHPTLASGAWAWSRRSLGAGIPDREKIPASVNAIPVHTSNSSRPGRKLTKLRSHERILGEECHD